MSNAQSGQQFQQAQMQQPMQQIAMQNVPQFTLLNDLIFVLNETEATSYPVAPGNSVTLWDKNKDTVYIKSVNLQGVPSMRILDYTERTAESEAKTSEKHVCECGKEFVKIKDFEALQIRFDELSAKVDGITTLTPKKAKTKEDTDNG
jgi:hypothetical protein